MSSAPSILTTIVGDGNTISPTVSTSHTLLGGPNRIILAFLTSEHGSTHTHTSVYYDTAGDNVAMTKIIEAGADDVYFFRMSIWRLDKVDMPTDGAHNVEATVSKSVDGISIHVVAIKDAAQTVQDFSSAAGEGGSSRNLTLDPTSVNSIMVTGFAVTDTSANCTPGTDQNEIEEEGISGFTVAISWEIATGITEGQSYSHDGTGNASVIVSACWEFEQTLMMPIIVM